MDNVERALRFVNEECERVGIGGDEKGKPDVALYYAGKLKVTYGFVIRFDGSGPIEIADHDDGCLGGSDCKCVLVWRPWR